MSRMDGKKTHTVYISAIGTVVEWFTVTVVLATNTNSASLLTIIYQDPSKYVLTYHNSIVGTVPLLQLYYCTFLDAVRSVPF